MGRDGGANADGEVSAMKKQPKFVPIDVTFQVLAAGLIAGIADWKPTHTKIVKGQLVLVWRKNSVALTITIRGPEHEMPIVVTGCSKHTAWNRNAHKSEVLNREHIAKVIHALWGEHVPGWEQSPSVKWTVEECKALVYQIGEQVRDLRGKCLSWNR